MADDGGEAKAPLVQDDPSYHEGRRRPRRDRRADHRRRKAKKRKKYRHVYLEGEAGETALLNDIASANTAAAVAAVATTRSLSTSLSAPSTVFPVFCYDRKRLLVLDIDQTLIDNIAVDGVNMDLFPAVNFVVQEDSHSYGIWARPHLKEFFETLAPYYEFAIFSAAAAFWVDTVVEHILEPALPEGDKFRVVWSRSHVRFSKERTIHALLNPESAEAKPEDRGHTQFVLKSLAELLEADELAGAGFSMRNTLIVDDREDTFDENPANGVKVPAYNILRDIEHRDCTLLRLALHLQRPCILGASDVRNVDQSCWKRSIEFKPDNRSSAVGSSPNPGFFPKVEFPLPPPPPPPPPPLPPPSDDNDSDLLSDEDLERVKVLLAAWGKVDMSADESDDDDESP